MGKTVPVSNPWDNTASSSFSSTASLDSIANLTEVNSFPINDPLRGYVKEKNDEGEEQRLLQSDNLFGGAWTAVPEKLVEDLALALETDQLDPSVTQFHHSSGSGSLSHKVLVHWVAPDDTLPGVALKYDIRVEHLRRFNRLWPSDNKAHRPYLFIPLSLTPKLNHYSREYPDLFYEVHLRTLEALPITSGPTYESAIPPVLRNKDNSKAPSPSRSSSFSSKESDNSDKKIMKEPKQRPILVIPNGQLKYFPSTKSQPTSRNKNQVFQSSKAIQNRGQIGNHLQSLGPLFSSPTRLSKNPSDNLPDELEAEIITKNLFPLFNTPRRFSPMSQTYQLQGSNLRKTASEFEETLVELEMKPLSLSSNSR